MPINPVPPPAVADPNIYAPSSSLPTPAVPPPPFSAFGQQPGMPIGAQSTGVASMQNPNTMGSSGGPPPMLPFPSVAQAQPQQQGPFGANLAATLPDEIQKKVVRFINEKYAWPQIQERYPYEGIWDAILEMYRIKLTRFDSNIPSMSQAGKDSQEDGDNLKVADSVVHDAIERLTDITHFVSFKEGMPVQYSIPEYQDLAMESDTYHPTSDKIKGGNALLQWNFDQEMIYRKHLIMCRHFYTYGIAFAKSEFKFKTDPQNPTTLSSIGTGFEVLPLRKLWLNYRLSAYHMEYQPCPFWFEETPRFALMQNLYDPQTNPFGYAPNAIARLAKGAINPAPEQWLFTEQETTSQREALQSYLSQFVSNDKKATQGLPNILEPKYSVESLWSYYPMLPLDPQTGEWETRADGSAVPFYRYIVDMFGANSWGNQVLLRLQRNYHPKDRLPIYGSAHMPDTDSGLYSPSIGYLLWNHYKEICTSMNQYIANKNMMNTPQNWVNIASPAVNDNLNKLGATFKVNGPNDIGYRMVPDATSSTVAMMQFLSESAKTTSKSTDALLGKAMGARTSATEASNAFQATMSAVTTPINLMNFDMMGGFAERVWDNAGTFMADELLQKITGNAQFKLDPNDLNLSVSLQWQVGSAFIASIVRQQNIQYILQYSAQDPAINRAELWRMLLNEWKFPKVSEIVNDQGFEREVAIATMQIVKAFETGQVQPINPDQNHQIALKLISEFLEDQDSVWMTQFKQNAPALVQMAQVHQQFIIMQQQAQILQQRAMEPDVPGKNASVPPPDPNSPSGGAAA